ncbi:hypothetical protein K474DRAFT_569009 [Panus rudis PR-1116 ss-1]|nr:hypothetical protein K474DRAFT_569009 [Panus rudis PR-1116 ss-1]
MVMNYPTPLRRYRRIPKIKLSPESLVSRYYVREPSVRVCSVSSVYRVSIGYYLRRPKCRGGCYLHLCSTLFLSFYAFSKLLCFRKLESRYQVQMASFVKFSNERAGAWNVHLVTSPPTTNARGPPASTMSESDGNCQ